VALSQEGRITRGMKIVERIQTARKLLRETKEEFGERFNVSEGAVRDWGKGTTGAYQVIEFYEMVIDNLQFCPAGSGTGVFNKSQERYIKAIGTGVDDIFLMGNWIRKKPRKIR
jgi:hypothetical protein